MWILTQTIHHDWAPHSGGPLTISILTSLFGPALRIILAATILYTVSGIHKQRKLCALTTSVIIAYLTFSYLYPMFYHSDTKAIGSGIYNDTQHKNDVEVSHVALFILSVCGCFVGMALGSLLPRLMAGVTLGIGLGVVGGAFIPDWMVVSGISNASVFTVLGPTFGLLGGIMTTRYVSCVVFFIISLYA